MNNIILLPSSEYSKSSQDLTANALPIPNDDDKSNADTITEQLATISKGIIMDQLNQQIKKLEERADKTDEKLNTMQLSIVKIEAAITNLSQNIDNKFSLILDKISNSEKIISLKLDHTEEKIINIEKNLEEKVHKYIASYFLKLVPIMSVLVAIVAILINIAFHFIK